MWRRKASTKERGILLDIWPIIFRGSRTARHIRRGVHLHERLLLGSRPQSVGGPKKPSLDLGARIVNVFMREHAKLYILNTI